MKMKRIFLPVIGFFFLLTSVAFSKPVSDTAIKDVALRWIAKSAVFASASSKDFSVHSIVPILLDGEDYPAFLVTLLPAGYIVVTADDQLPPVLAFSPVSTAKLADVEANGFRKLLKADLQSGKKIINERKSFKKGGVAPHENFVRKNRGHWQKLLEVEAPSQSGSTDEPSTASANLLADTPNVAPLLTTQWDQSRHYNYLLQSHPSMSDYYDGKVPVGCVATAVAQILNYYQWPRYGRGGGQYVDSSGTVTGAHAGQFADQYDFTNMQSSYDPWSSEPAAAVEAISEIMYEMGIAAEMDYEPDGSASSPSWLSAALSEQFYFELYDFVGADFVTRLKGALSSLRPTLTSIPGHVVVVDGYSLENTNDFFHVNYGWGGTNDGWYLVDGVPGGAIEGLFVGIAPRQIPLPVANSQNDGEVNLQWFYPDNLVHSVQNFRIYGGELTTVSSLFDSADDFTVWERGQGEGGLWEPIDGSFYSPGGHIGMRSLNLSSLLVPSASSHLTFQIKTILGAETVSTEVSTDHGQTWTSLREWSNTGYNPSWQSIDIDLSDYDNQEILLRFHVRFEGGSYYPTGGVWLDDLEITNCQAIQWNLTEPTVVASGASPQDYLITNLDAGRYFYRVQAQVNNEWQEISPWVEVAVAAGCSDSDGDGLSDCVDNCPAVMNADQSDVNNNGIGDACDTESDTDGDGLTDAEEFAAGLNPQLADTDGDGIVDGIDQSPLSALNRTPNDFNGDGTTDLLTRHKVTGEFWLYTVESGSVTDSSSVSYSNPDYKHLATADFDGNGTNDILTRYSTGLLWVKLLDGSTVTKSAQLPFISSDWVFVAAADTNADGKADIVLRNQDTGVLWVYQVSGTNISASRKYTNLDLAWEVVGIKDLNADHKADLLARNSTTGQFWAVLFDGTTVSAAGSPIKYSLDWQVVGFNDHNGDDKADILVRNSSTGQFWMCLLDGTSMNSQGKVATLEANWTAIQFGDYNGDDKADLLVRDTNTGRFWMYILDGFAIVEQGSPLIVDPSWELQPAGDYTGDGLDDILMRNSETGMSWLYELNSTTSTSNGKLTTVDPLWETIWPITIHVAPERVAEDDHNADGTADILLKSQATDLLWLYQMNGNQIADSSKIAGLPNDWSYQGRADFTGDGKVDIVIRNNTTGVLWLYVMDGNSITDSKKLTNLDLVWDVASLADYTGDGIADILLKNQDDLLWLYTYNGTSVTGSNKVIGLPTGWSVQASGDYNGDGKTDILIRNDTTGLLWQYLMDGHTITANQKVAGLGLDWTVVDSADLTGDGKSDILIRSSSGLLWLYSMDGNSITDSQKVTGLSLDWQVEECADYNNDSKADILVRNSSGLLWLYSMDGNSISASQKVTGLSLDWQVME